MKGLDVKLMIMLLFGLVVALLIIYPAIVGMIGGLTVYGTSNPEYIMLTANTAKVVSYTPIYSFVSLYRDNVSTASNLVAGNIDDSLTKSLSTNNAISFQTDANLTINCEYDGDEDIDFYFGTNYLASMGMPDTCPYTISGIDQAYIGDPSTNLVMESSGSSLMEQGHNDTIILLNDTAYVYFYTTKQNDTSPFVDTLKINITIQNPIGDLTELHFNTLELPNITSNVQVSGIMNYNLNANGSQSVKFLDLNGTDPMGLNITNVSWSYEYLAYESNFTNATLSYERWSAYPAANYSVGTTTISANHSGLYEIGYIYGTSAGQTQLNLLGLIPILVILGIIAWLGYQSGLIG